MNRSVGRALTILEVLAGSDDALGLKEVSTQLEIPKSSALMLLRSLKEHGFIEVDEHGRYTVGLRAFEVGSSFMRGMSPTRAAEPQLRQLTTVLGVTSHFAVLDGADVVYLAKEEPQDMGVRLASFVGARLPALTTAVGKAQLAHADIEALGVDAAKAKELFLSRERGYAIDDGAVLEGVRCVAAPVFLGGQVCGAIGVSYLSRSSTRTTEIARLVVDAAAAATQRLGGSARRTGVA